MSPPCCSLCPPFLYLFRDGHHACDLFHILLRSIHVSQILHVMSPLCCSLCPPFLCLILRWSSCRCVVFRSLFHYIYVPSHLVCWGPVGWLPAKHAASTQHQTVGLRTLLDHAEVARRTPTPQHTIRAAVCCCRGRMQIYRYQLLSK